MPDNAQINRSLSSIRTELTYLRDSGVLLPQQMESILAQLPQNGEKSNYIDPRYSPEQWQPPPQVFNQVSQAAQNPQSPAHPDNPKHHEWAKGMASRFGQAALWGAGMTFGGDLVNDVMKHV